MELKENHCQPTAESSELPKADFCSIALTRPTIKNIDNFWQKVGAHHYRHNTGGTKYQSGFHFSDLPAEPAYRNAKVQFQIEFEGGPNNFHIALCFRKIDFQRCYSVG